MRVNCLKLVPSKQKPRLRGFSQEHGFRKSQKGNEGLSLPVKSVEKTYNHFLAPKHVMLSKEQAAELLKKYNLTLDLLPKILGKDAAIAELSPEKNEIVKIVRNSPTAGKTVYYRRVV